MTSVWDFFIIIYNVWLWQFTLKLYVLSAHVFVQEPLH